MRHFCCYYKGVTYYPLWNLKVDKVFKFLVGF